LHLVGILFPHINDDARSESLHFSRELFTLPLKSSSHSRCGTENMCCDC